MVQEPSTVFLVTSGGSGLQRSIYKSVWGVKFELRSVSGRHRARTSNTATLFAGMYLTAGSLRNPFRKSMSTRSTVPELPNYFHHPMTPIPTDAAGMSAQRGGSEEWLEVKSGVCGITGSTL